MRVRSNIAAVAALALVGGAAPAASVRGPGVPLAISFWNARDGVAAFERAVGWTDDGGRTWHVRRHARLGSLSVVPGTREAWADDAAGLVHSGDGGRTWSRAAAHLEGATFVDRRRGWAFRPAAIEAGPLVATADGGRTWRRLGLPCPRAFGAAASFVSVRRGWLLCTGQPGTGMQTKAVYETGDGGRRWQLVMDASFHRFGHVTRHGVSTSGYAQGIDFVRGGAGWLWESRGSAFATADGGRTWKPLAFSVPESVEARSISFVSPTVGFMLLQDGRHRRFALERTADGGRTWRVVRAWPLR